MPLWAAFWVFLGLLHNSCWQLPCVYIRSRWYGLYFWLRFRAEFRLKIYSEQTKTEVARQEGVTIDGRNSAEWHSGFGCQDGDGYNHRFKDGYFETGYILHQSFFLHVFLRIFFYFFVPKCSFSASWKLQGSTALKRPHVRAWNQCCWFSF